VNQKNQNLLFHRENCVRDKLKISYCRSLRPYSNKEYIKRFLWSLAFPFFRYSPRKAFFWRKFLLVIFGAKIGRRVHIYPSVKIYLPWMLEIGNDSSIGEWTLIYNLGKVTIGNRSTISHMSHICAGTHDYNNLELPLKRLPIKIGSQVWVCSNVFVGPNTNIGNDSIVGAGSVVIKDVPENSIVGGNPAVKIKDRWV